MGMVVMTLPWLTFATSNQLALERVKERECCIVTKMYP